MVDRVDQGSELLEGPVDLGCQGRGRAGADRGGSRRDAGGAGREECADARQPADGGDLHAERWCLGAMGHAVRDFVWALLGLWLLLCSWSGLGSAELRAPPDKIGRREGKGVRERAPRQALGVWCTRPRSRDVRQAARAEPGRAQVAIFPDHVSVPLSVPQRPCLPGQGDMPT